jgi:hypothetical protein
MTKTASEQAHEKLQRALKQLGENPVALLLLEGDADPGQLLEATDALVAVACGEAKKLQDRALTKMAKVVRKDWGRFLGGFRSMAQEVSRVAQQKGDG